MKKKKYNFKIISTILVISIIFIGLCVLGVIEPETNKQVQHECTNFIKYREHYQITPMSWYYRDSFKCTECGKDWKNTEN